MSTMKDITTRINNLQNATRTELADKCLSTISNFSIPNENSYSVDTDPVKPHFTTSTTASGTQLPIQNAQSRPRNLVSLDLETSNQSGWIASTSKRLHITKSKSTNETNMTTMKKQISPKTTNSKATSKKTRVPIPNASKVTAGDRRLPIATIVSGSPVSRRSLMDATEKPLRRSISPSPGVQQIEEWPALSPSQNITLLSTELNRRSTESNILIASAPPENATNVNTDPQTPGQAEVIDTLPTDAGALCSRESGLSNPVSAGASDLVETVEQSSQNQNINSDAVVRQTKTSLMRARLFGENSFVADRRRVTLLTDKLSYLTLNDDNEQGQSQDVTKFGMNPLRAGPSRSRTNPRCLVTSRGSPYSTAMRSKAKLIEVKNRNCPTNRDALQEKLKIISTAPNYARNSSKAVVVKGFRPVRDTERRSSVPLPSPLIWTHNNGDNEAEMTIIKSDTEEDAKIVMNTQDSDDGDSNTEAGKNTKQLKMMEALQAESLPDLMTKESVKAPATTTPTGVDLSLSSSDEGSDSELGELHSFGAFEPAGYWVRRLSTLAPNHGPVLRVSDAADSVIFGKPQKQKVAQLTRHDSRRSSAPDLCRSILLRDTLRKAKKSVGAPLPPSITSRSLDKDIIDDDMEHENTRDPYHMASHSRAQLNATKNSHISGSHAKCHWLKGIEMSDDSTKSMSCPVEHDKSISPRNILGEENWPLANSKSLPTELDSVHELMAEEEAPQIPSLARRLRARNTEDDDPTITAPEVPAPLNSPVSSPPKLNKRHSTPLSYGGASQIDISPSTARGLHKSDSTAPMHSSAHVHPPRNSSKLHVRTWNNSTHVQQMPSTNSASGQTPIPNRLTSLVSSPLGNHSMHIDCTNSFRSETIRTLADEITDLNAPISHEVTQSRVRALKSSSTSVLSNFRGIFHKSSAGSGVLSGSRITPSSHRSRAAKANQDGCPFPNASSPVPYNTTETSRYVKKSHGMKPPSNRLVDQTCNGKSKLAGLQIETDEMQNATMLALDVLDLAKVEDISARKGILVHIGRTMVQAIGASRDAEKAVEEAKQATARAEISALITRKKVQEIVGIVEGVVGGNR